MSCYKISEELLRRQLTETIARCLSQTPFFKPTLENYTDLDPGLTRFTSDRVRLLANFIPRWLIIVVVLILYARLYRIIYKAHNRFMSFNDESSPRHLETHSVEPETESVSSTRRIGRPSASMHITSKDVRVDVEENGDSVPGPTHVRQPSPVLKKMARQMMSYPLVYMLIWTIPTVIRIYQSVTGRPAPFAIGTVDKVSFCFPTM